MPGEGLRLIEDLAGEPIDLERTRVAETEWAGHSGATYLVFRPVD